MASIVGTSPVNEDELVADSPVAIFVTVIVPPAPHPGGGFTRICVPVTEMTVASWPPKRTCRGATNPWPRIVTTVLASPSTGENVVIERGTVYVNVVAPLLWQLVPEPQSAFLTMTGSGAPVVPVEVPSGSGGVMTMIWLKVTETISAWTPPKKTWTGDEKPEPRIVARVPPSFVPELGRIAETTGCRLTAVNVKQPAEVIVVAPPTLTMTSATLGFVGSRPVNAGVVTLIVVSVTLVTMPGSVVEPMRKRTWTAPVSVPKPPP